MTSQASQLPRFRLYHYWRSSSSWRVRWALELKGVTPSDWVTVNLLSDEAEAPEHRSRNPLGYIPVVELLEAKSGQFPFLSESMAILQWLEAYVPRPAIFPLDPWKRARCLQFCELINAGTQPLQNPNVAAAHSTDPETQKKWMTTWIQKGLQAYEDLLVKIESERRGGSFTLGSELSAAELFLIPQLYNARRFGVKIEEFPIILGIETSVSSLQSYQASHPDRYAPPSL
jgi:maleylpyruvate isomerase